MCKWSDPFSKSAQTSYDLLSEQFKLALVCISLQPIVFDSRVELSLLILYIEQDAVSYTHLNMVSALQVRRVG